jgi:2-polyprenyl-3-methyl-5-hydroxy-6-metoxy-1,4-benzoquinol methylase
MAIVCPILARPSSGFEVVLRREQWELVRCRETGFVFLANPPVYNQLKSEFAWEKTYEAEKKRRQETEPTVYAASQIAKDIKFKINPRRNRIADMAVRAVTGSGSRNVRILDIGCGSGRLMLELCQRYEKQNVQAVPFGIEVSEQLAAESSNIVTPLGGAIIKNHAVGGCRSLKGQSDKFDLVMMSCFLEHEAQPLELLRSLHPLLSSSGSIVIKVPNYASWNRQIRGSKWCGYRFPDHVNYFTPRTLQMLASEAGFTCFQQSWLDRNPFNDNMYAVVRK